MLIFWCSRKTFDAENKISINDLFILVSGKNDINNIYSACILTNIHHVVHRDRTMLFKPTLARTKGKLTLSNANHSR